MSVVDVLDRRVVDLKMKAKNKDEAIRHLSGLLKDAGYVEDVQVFVADIYEREEEGITGIGDHIAIPHGKSDAVHNIGIAVGKLEEMIEWESLDEEPIDLIFLFAVSKSQYDTKHLRLLSDLAGRLGRNNTIRKLREMETFEDLLAAFADESYIEGEDLEVINKDLEITIEL